MNTTKTDTDTLINSAFNEMDCVAPGDHHIGDKHSYLIWHDCFAGFLCKGHHDALIDSREEMHASQLLWGHMVCGYCNKTFPNVDALYKLYPLT